MLANITYPARSPYSTLPYILLIGEWINHYYANEIHQFLSKDIAKVAKQPEYSTFQPNNWGDYMERLSKILASIALLSLSACAQPTLTIPYTPQTTQELSGRITVADFGYFPKQGLKENEIHETAAGQIFITDPVGKFIGDAVRREFRQSGLSLKDGGCALEGEVNDFTLDSLGFSTDYITDFRYILNDAKKRVLLDNTYKVKFNASKFVQPSIVMANINKVIADNIAQLMNDPNFQKSVKAQCR